ncbi:hypothetical protein [Tessaracoccus coleopterorum]|uniref:hypothetical protein n=1 Tax=Tessaracoccus coleopterorum TaxID=2714950 RepID=UPI0018D2C6F8|nr:hypothetical protein [Tessaracoccus coleopterorum]
MAVAQHRLTEQIDVEVGARGAQPAQRRAERAAHVHHQVADQGLEHAPHHGKQRPRRPGDDAAQPEPQRGRKERCGCVGQTAQGRGRHPRILGAQHQVDEVEREPQPVLVTQHVRQQGRRARLREGAAGLGPPPRGRDRVVEMFRRRTHPHDTIVAQRTLWRR